MEASKKEKWLRPVEAAAMLGISLSTLYKRQHLREIPYYKDGKCCFYLEEDLKSYLRHTRKRMTANYELEQQVSNEILINGGINV